jgi:hypothetical protein
MQISRFLYFPTTFTLDPEYTQFVACRDLIGSIYPENLIYDGTGFRTKRVNAAVQLIYLINKQLDSNKKETNQNISVLSLMVGDEGFEPPTPSV